MQDPPQRPGIIRHMGTWNEVETVRQWMKYPQRVLRGPNLRGQISSLDAFSFWRDFVMAVPGERTRIPQKREGIKGGYLTSKSLRLFKFAKVNREDIAGGCPYPISVLILNYIVAISCKSAWRTITLSDRRGKKFGPHISTWVHASRTCASIPHITWPQGSSA